MKRLIYQFHVDFKDRSKNVFGKNFNRNDIGEYWNYSIDSVRQYCDKYGIDYKLDQPSEEEYKPWAFGVETFDKYRSIQYLCKYDQVLYLDTDIIVNPLADNIFDAYQDVGLVGAFHTAADRSYNPDNRRIGGLLNTGVLLFNNDHPLCSIVEKQAGLASVPNFLIRSDITSANKPRGSKYNKELLAKFQKPNGTGYWKWWENWEELFSDYVTYLKDGSVSDENLFHHILSVYKLLPFHIDRKWNYPYALYPNLDIVNFIHFLGNDKKGMKEVYEYYFQ